MSDSALGLTVVGLLVLLVVVAALLDLRRRGRRSQVSDAAVRRARGGADAHLPPVRRDGSGVF